MATHTHHGPAEIVQFPEGMFRRRSRPLGETADVVTFRRAPETICYEALENSWYHAEAIREADKDKKRLD